MLEQKQIEEMSEDVARMLCEIYRPNCDEYQPHSCSKCYVNSTPIGCFVEMLYEAGYRKQSEGEWNLECQAVYEYKKQLIAEEHYKAAHNKTEWISVEERLPERVGTYLVYTYKGAIKFGDFRCYYAKNDKPQFDCDVTHWMPIPEAPKGGEG